MYIQNEALMRKAQENNRALQAAKAYEAACGKVPFGSLNAYDIVRLWDAKGERTVENVGARARQLVAEKSLPLFELGVGSWVVEHMLGLPPEDRE